MNGLTFPELLRFTEQEAERWHQYLAGQDGAVLDLPVELAGKTVRDLLVHLFAVELKYANLLAGEPLPSYDRLPTGTLEAIFGIGAESRAKLRRFLEGAPETKLQEAVTFPTLSAGQQSATKRKVLGHALIHSLRHWAQLTSEMRQRGYKTDWHHDLLFSDALE